MQVKKAVAEDADSYIFLWSPKKLSPEKAKLGNWDRKILMEFVDGFDKTGVAETPWRCFKYEQIRPGNRAYLLQSGKQRGLLGRGYIAEKPKKFEKEKRVLIRFERERGDVLWNPDIHLPVDALQLLNMNFKTPRKSGWPLS